jgi:hypothetical protein
MVGEVSMSKHTPGPWFWDVRKKYNVFRLCSPIRGTLIVMDFSRWGMQSAQPRFSDRNGEKRGGIMEDGSKIDLSKNPDARLIAAAPDLLEACRAALKWYGLDGDGISEPVLSQLRTAIAKAETE